MTRIGFALFGILLATSVRAEPFDFYVLALSWSPAFCAAEGAEAPPDQCAPALQKRFVTHGLWPQRQRGYPAFCAPARSPSQLDLAAAKEVFPTSGLARYQWRKHGSCSGLAPSAYFETTGRARTLVRIPEIFQNLETDLTLSALEVERAFVEANPGLRADMMAVSCPKNILRDVRICFDKNLKGFQTCPELDQRGCRAQQLEISAPPR